MTWNNEIMMILANIRTNCIVLSEYNRKKYYQFNKKRKYFQIPLIILSSINATTAVSLQTFIDQKYVSLINCGLAMICGMITSTELYLDLQSSMEIHLKMAKQFYTLAINIYKIIELNVDDRMDDAVQYVNAIVSEYIKLVEESKLLNHKFKHDTLIQIPPLSVGSSTASSDEENNNTV